MASWGHGGQRIRTRQGRVAVLEKAGENLGFVWAKGVSSLYFSDFFSFWLSDSSDSLHPWQQGRVLQ